MRPYQKPALSHGRNFDQKRFNEFNITGCCSSGRQLDEPSGQYPSRQTALPLARRSLAELTHDACPSVMCDCLISFHQAVHHFLSYKRRERDV
jgi:hypothetical protein